MLVVCEGKEREMDLLYASCVRGERERDGPAVR